MTKSNENRNMWRINRHGAGTKRRIRKLAHGPLKRLRFFQQTGQYINSLGLCSYNWLKLRLGGRKNMRSVSYSRVDKVRCEQ